MRKKLWRLAATVGAVAIVAALGPSLVGSPGAGAASGGPKWTQIATSTQPTPRQDAAMAYDAATQQLILFGGQVFNSATNSYSVLGDTWLWTGSNWTQLSPATAPSARALTHMAYDEASQQLILFGGQDGFQNFLNDTWMWTGSTWTQLSPATSPLARASGALAYDPGTQQLVLYGGIGTPFNYMYDTWAWNGTTWAQQLDQDRTFLPLEPLQGAAFAADPPLGWPILFGGAFQGAPQGATWRWAPLWEEFGNVHNDPAPPARYSPSMAYDQGTGQLLLFGGYDGNNALNDIWSFNGSIWLPLFPSTSPPVRTDASMAYDAALDQLVLFGGFGGYTTGGFPQPTYNDTWVWSSPASTQTPPPPTTPTRAVLGPRGVHAATTTTTVSAASSAPTPTTGAAPVAATPVAGAVNGTPTFTN